MLQVGYCCFASMCLLVVPSKWLKYDGNRCLADGKYQQAMGIALECHRLDKLDEAISKSDNVHSMLAYCLRLVQTYVTGRLYREEVSRSPNCVYLSPHLC